MFCRLMRYRIGSTSVPKPRLPRERSDPMATATPAKGALVVVDMQNDYCNPRGVYPRHGLNCFDMDSVVAATATAVTTCKARMIPVIYLRMARNTHAREFPIEAG